MDVTLADPLVGAVLDGRYRIRGRIARGGMATVYDAVDERLERVVAVKVMHPTYAADPLFIDRFIREAKAAARLNHPHVVAVFDQGSHDELAFLVMEQVPGRTLRDVLAERGRLSVPEALTVFDAVLDALAAAHRSGLVHRDVKPENVLIGVDGAVKVADFGLARAVESSSHTSTGNVVMGTVAYVAPEQIVSGHADTRSDVYSAGVMLFEMLTGTVPFGGDSAVNIAFQHVNSAVPPPSSRLREVPPALDELVVRATRREAGARPTDAGAFLAELRHVRTDIGAPIVPVSAQASPRMNAAAMPTRAVAPPTELHQQLPPAARRPARSRGGLIAVVVLVTLALVAAGAGWWLGAGQYTQAPSLISMDRAQAVAKARAAGLSVAFGRQEYSEATRKGLVVRQDPVPSGRVRKGGEVLVIVSLGPERYQVPHVKGLAQDAAQQALAATHLKSTTKSVFSDDVQSGIVIDTDPREGTSLTRDTIVTLTVSQGGKPADLPDLTGKTRSEAEQILADLGLTANVTERDVGDDESQRGRVLQQQPGPGSVPPKTTVQLTVGQGDARVQVPNLQGMSFDDAKRALRDQGLKLQRIGGHGQALFQLPLAGTQVDSGSEVKVWFSR